MTDQPPSPPVPRFGWRELHWTRPLDPLAALSAIRALSADQTSPVVCLEVRAHARQLRYLLGCSAVHLTTVARRLRDALPDVQISELADERTSVTAAARLQLSTRHRALRGDEPEHLLRQLLGALHRVDDGEVAVVQLLLGPRRIPLAVPNHSPSSVVMPWYEVAWKGNGGLVDGEKRAALRDKVSDHGFAATVRIGVRAADRDRRRHLILSVFNALRLSEAPGLQARLRPDNVRALNAGRAPWRWPLRINSSEALLLSGWPIGEDELPGLPPLHPKQVAPSALAKPSDRVVAAALAPGVTGNLGYSVTDALRHSWIIGPTGTGKSTLLLNLITQDLAANRPLVVVEPNDLVADVLQRIPASRRDDVVVLDPTDSVPVGINPLERHGRTPDVVADGLLATFQALYGESGLGPRSTDILLNCLQVLAAHGQASLVMLPLLLTNPGFRRSLVAPLVKSDPIAAGPFWAWYDNLSDDARSQVIAPLSNKLRRLLRPAVRGVLAQRQPRFNVRDVLTQRKVLLVPLQPGVVGPDVAQLLAALVISELWLALRERRAIPEDHRTPIMIYIDEVQQYLRLPTDLADALATSRSLKAGWHLAHQYRDQLGPSMRAALDANARNRICFQLNASDARAMAAGQSAVTPDDFTALPAFHVYASLMRGNSLQPWASGTTLPAPAPCSDPADIRARSRARYGQALDSVEADFAALASDHLSTAPTSNRRARGSA